MPELRVGLNDKLEDATFHQVSGGGEGMWVWMGRSEDECVDGKE
jgi:hypothetical protein